MAETDAYCLSPIGIVFDVAGLFAVWSDNRSWGPSIGCGFGLFNGGVFFFFFFEITMYSYYGGDLCGTCNMTQPSYL